MGRISQSVCTLVGAALLFAATAATAQTWPAKPITIIVPFVAGGTTDIVTRLVGQALSQRLGQPVVIENVGGAGGTLGATNAARAPADGYTVFMSTIAHTIAPGIYKKLAYDFEKDFDPITVVASVPNILLVNPDVPAQNVSELISYIKANPSKVNFGSAGVGSVEHLAGELFRSTAKLEMVHVPYRGGAPMMADIVAGHIQMAIETSGAATPFVKSNKVRALAVSTAKRTPLFPELPTLAESGLPGYDVTTWYGTLVPRGTPPDVRQKLYSAIAEILKDPMMASKFADIGAEPGGMLPEEFATFIASETAKWTKLSKEAGISAE
ncbi:MAG: tripartite tricarboxylate transporter substrate binding protein [Xanthobacteraceae bacterium]